jgi:hypothetical protein
VLCGKFVQVRRARHEFFTTALRHSVGDPHPADGAARARPPEIAVSDLLPAVVSRLATMDRYQRRPPSRRKFAIRAFDAAAGAELLGTQKLMGRGRRARTNQKFTNEINGPGQAR